MICEMTSTKSLSPVDQSYSSFLHRSSIDCFSSLQTSKFIDLTYQFVVILFNSLLFARRWRPLMKDFRLMSLTRRIRIRMFFDLFRWDQTDQNFIPFSIFDKSLFLLILLQFDCFVSPLVHLTTSSLRVCGLEWWAKRNSSSRFVQIVKKFDVCCLVKNRNGSSPSRILFFQWIGFVLSQRRLKHRQMFSSGLNDERLSSKSVATVSSFVQWSMEKIVPRSDRMKKNLDEVSSNINWSPLTFSSLLSSQQSKGILQIDIKLKRNSSRKNDGMSHHQSITFPLTEFEDLFQYLWYSLQWIRRWSSSID